MARGFRLIFDNFSKYRDYKIGVNYLLGQCEGNISKETLLDYCNRMKMRNVIDNFVVEDFILTITIYRIYDEVDKYRMDNRYAESPKQKSERKEKVLSVETRFPERHSGCA